MIGANITAFGFAALGTPTKTGITQQATGLGQLSASTTYHFQVSALNIYGFALGSTGHGSADADGESDATTDVSIATAGGGSAGDKSITFGWTSVRNAYSYNVFGSVAGGASNVYLGTFYTNRATINIITSTSTNVPNTVDQTGDANAYLGIVGLIGAAGSNAYVTSLAGASLTSDGTSGVEEIDAANLSIFQNYQAGVDVITMGPATRKAIDKIILGSTAPVFRVDLQNGSSAVRGSITADTILNRYTGRTIRLEVHPFFPSGLMVGRCENLGPYYPLAGLPTPIEMAMGLDQIQFDFAQSGTYFPFGMYSIGAPLLRITFPHFVIRDVGPIGSYGATA